jgi:hypothetical protein
MLILASPNNNAERHQTALHAVCEEGTAPRYGLTLSGDTVGGWWLGKLCPALLRKLRWLPALWQKPGVFTAQAQLQYSTMHWG